MKIIIDLRRLFGRAPEPDPVPVQEESAPKPEPRRLLISGRDAWEVAKLMDDYQKHPSGRDNAAKVLLWQAILKIHPETLEGKWTITVRRSYVILEEVL